MSAFAAVHLPRFDGATGWLNSPPLESDDLLGNVVLAHFWTYTCINWLRTLPYVRAWFERYAEHGLVIVGVHTPEFPFERDRDNVREAARAMRVDYPIALDPDYAVWDAFSNRYWPAVYIADSDGRIRYEHFGEGSYDETERVIQKLLRDAGAAGIGDDLVDVVPDGFEAQADWANLRSPEAYLGFQQAVSAPARDARDLDLNDWALTGDWTVDARAVVLNQPGGQIAFRFHARDVNLVMRAQPGTTVPFQVLIDGESPGDAHGVDVDDEGHGTLVEPRMYQLVREPATIADRTLELTFEDPGVELYVFTFG
jgi:thiol-disulfide isomerase/thioredoxin